MKHVVFTGCLMLFFCGCREQKRLEREATIQLDQLEKERQIDAYRRSPAYQQKVIKQLNAQMPTKKDWDVMRVP